MSTTISYADVGRGPDTSALLDAALAAGRQGDPPREPHRRTQGRDARRHARPRRHIRPRQAGGRRRDPRHDDRPDPRGRHRVGRPGGTFSFSPAKDGRAVDKAALLAALDQQLAALGTPASITMAVPVVSLAPAVATTSAEAAKAAADRMAADVVVARGKDTWTIAGTSLAPLISFSTAADGTITPVFDESGLDPLVKTLAKKVDRTAQGRGPQAGRRTHRRHRHQPRGPHAQGWRTRRPRSSARSQPARRARRHRRSRPSSRPSPRS